jgi:deoxyadenosine/deoxycytidine kinase
MALIISIDGNIGSGKTTFINELKKQNLDNVIFIDEPVDLWSKIIIDNETILQKFYQDQKNTLLVFRC